MITVIPILRRDDRSKAILGEGIITVKVILEGMITVKAILGGMITVIVILWTNDHSNTNITEG
jgi:hypothetical protein